MSAARAAHIPLSPRQRATSLGHEAAEKQIVARWQSGAFPHALLITGPRGIGKAAFAYRIARFLLSRDHKPATGLFGELPPSTLDLPESHPIFQRVSAGGHADLLAIEPPFDEKKGEYKREIPVEAARKVGGFLSLTPSESAWRVVVVDSIDQMNRNAANAILKVLEEPPDQAVLLLVSHNPSALLPTIRSRCQLITLAPPPLESFLEIMREQAPELSHKQALALHQFAQGSPGIALGLAGEDILALYGSLINYIGKKEDAALSFLLDRLGGKGTSWQTVELLFETLFTRLIKSAAGIALPAIVPGEREALAEAARTKPLDRWLKLWEKTRALLADTGKLHLDARQSISQVLHYARRETA